MISQSDFFRVICLEPLYVAKQSPEWRPLEILAFFVYDLHIPLDCHVDISQWETWVSHYLGLMVLVHWMSRDPQEAGPISLGMLADLDTTPDGTTLAVLKIGVFWNYGSW